ncbi:type I glyceraldehyde-3-phosphate dehydrogenase [bacterium]|nr:type I glyceraldehyde-3-phosphate dehydrogenase [bacterium]NBW98498.1 type I glyceraldehyde-3-phosphate dehydrogenase [bacterium]NBX82483.1 type I glyceraldehyde-3-phosphate dehydrogenase [bacterium]
MKKTKIAINGFGRIGRVTTRLLMDRPEFELVAINDLTPTDQAAHLLKYDSVHGVWGKSVKADKESFEINGQKVQVFAMRDPAELPWAKLGIDLVIESTGVFTDYAGSSKHLKAGAKKVIVSAPCKDNDKIRTFVVGINHETYNPAQDHIVSNASCTTNCLAPVVKVLNDNFKVQRGLMTTVHSYTNDQRVLDLVHSDYRRMRAAGLNMIPTSTGAAKAVTLVIPELKGKLTGTAVRVPTPNVSLVDFVADLGKTVTVEEVNEAFVRAAQTGPLKNILNAVKEELVSSDFNGTHWSSSVDLQSTLVIDGSMVKVLSWYDNETGFSCRMLDLARWMTQSL